MNEQVVRDIRTMVNGSAVDYRKEYIQLFAAYNLWFRCVTGMAVERRAMQQLKRRGEIWRDILRGDIAPGLRGYLIRLYALTQHRPLAVTRWWSGALQDTSDWSGLLEFWYVIRCDIVHGTPALRSPFHQIYVKLAYETLLLFMIEITRRMSLAVASESLRVPPLHRLDLASSSRIPPAP